MADFRRWFTALAVLALMVGAASAQVGTATGGLPGSSAGALACVATAAGTPELRPEGFTELAGDIIISCTGGPPQAAGTAINTTNIVVYMVPGVPITSRLIGSPSGSSEALLIIDEAGSSLLGGAPGYGPTAPQSLCTVAQEQAIPSPCAAVVGLSGGYEVAVTAGGTTAAPNVYQGKIGDFGANSVAFYNVPVLPPATTGVSRIFRITNVRVPVPQAAGSGGISIGGSLQALVSASPSQVLPVSQTQINIGIVGPQMTAAVKPVTTAFKQCVPTTSGTPALTSNLIFTEGFATAFKTRVVPGGATGAGNTLYAAEGTNTATTGTNQNIPGGLYANFANNSESGFIYPPLTTTTSGGTTYTAGLADFGTRLKAVFTNIPAGLTLYVSTTSKAQPTGFVPGGTSVLPYAVLVATNSGEATPDGTSFATTSGAPYLSTTPLGSDGLVAYPLAQTAGGSATAVWEVTNANPASTDVLTFSVYVAYSATSSTTTNPYGLPITDLPLGANVNNVQLSLAPEPGGGTFSTSNAASPGTNIIPRFIIANPNQQGRFTTINLCQTTLLYPFVTGASGFDTGIAIANTSADPFGTTNQQGSCNLYAYGVTVATAGNTPYAPTSNKPQVPGCDSLANPLPGTNCFAIVPAGQVMSVMASAVLTNFQGYVIAVCNFQLAHGYAAVTDLGLRNLWSSYLALELSNGGVGSPRSLGGGSGIENLVH